MGVGLALALTTLPTAACVDRPPEFPEVPSWRAAFETPAAVEAKAKELAEESESALESLDEEAFFDRPEILSFLEDVVRRLWPDDGRDPLPPGLRVRVSNSAEANAAAWPNGLIVIGAGLLTQIENEAQLAALLGHELVHALEYHSAVQAIYAERTSSHVDRMVFSKELEARADDGAYRMMLDAGYSPRECVGMLRLLQQREAMPVRGRIRAWESHPDLLARIRRMQRRAVKDAEEGEWRIGAEEWTVLIDPIRLEVALLEIESGDREFAERNVSLYLERHPESGRAHWVRAEILKVFDRDDEGREGMLEALKEAYRLSPDDADILRALGMERRRREDHSRATDLLERYLEERPDAIDRRLIERYLETKVTGIAE